jgi:hypothetical protein
MSKSADNIYTALLQVQGAMVAIKKDEQNPFFKSSYVSLNAVREAIIPSLTKNGLVLLQPTIVLDGKQYVRTTIVHADTKESITSDTEVITKNASDAQLVGSGISYARRYGLMSILALAAEDDDGNAASGKTTKSESAQAPTVAPSPAVGATSNKKPSFMKKSTSAPAPVAAAQQEEEF